jgi:glyoxylase-like metal-dependent hydrolase (beta-lactamase superfamily II)
MSRLILAAILLGAASPTPSDSGTFPERWIDGTDPDEPAIQVHPFEPDTWILRQSLRTHWEAPFLYLLCGEKKALLLDTGAGGAPVRETVDGLLAGRKVELVVAHSHAHPDHVAGDATFTERPDTTVVGVAPAEVARHFGLEGWPEGSAPFDLGGRIVDVIPIPGHEASSIALYDRRTRLLLTGDSLYPGRLYVRDFDAYLASVERLVAFTESNPVAWMLGTHIEMTREPKRDFPRAAPEHRDERKLQLERAHLLELRDALRAMRDSPRREAHDDFIVYPVRSSR